MRITRLFSWRAVRVTLFILGLSTLAGLIHQIGPLRIYEAAAKVGPLGMVIILLPSTVMYLIDCVGWRMTLGGHARKVSFFRLFMIRMAGEVVNATTPTGSVGGEPVKAYLLERYGISMVDGFASVIIAKTTMTIAQIAYILTGIGLGFALLLPPQGIYLSVMAILTSLALVSLGIALLMVQRQGLFTILFALLRKWRWRVAALEGRRQKLLALDQAVLAFYSRSRAAFLLSTAAFLAGWMVEAVEVLSETLEADLPAAARERLGIQPGQKNVLLRVILRHLARTLSHEEANQLRDRIWEALISRPTVA